MLDGVRIHTRIQLASKTQVQGFAIHEKGFFSLLQGLEMGWRGVAAVGTHAQQQVDSKKKTRLSFLMEEYVQDVKQCQKLAPGLLELSGEAHCSCKRRVTEENNSNDTKRIKIKYFDCFEIIAIYYKVFTL